MKSPLQSEDAQECPNKNNMKKVIDKLFENYYYASLVIRRLESGLHRLWEA